MATTFFEIDTGILKQNISSLKQELGRMEQTFAELISGVTSLDSMWSGAAHAAFMVQFTSDCETYEAYCKTISEYIECLEYAVREYENCESKVNAAVNAVRR